LVQQLQQMERLVRELHHLGRDTWFRLGVDKAPAWPLFPFLPEQVEDQPQLV
jgi:hypothetical protein